MNYGVRGLYTQTANQGKNQESAPIRQLAQAGMKGDDTIGHLTTGEMILPKSAQTPGLMALMAKHMRSKGMNPEQYVVGSPESNLRRNPITGAQQFYGDDGYGDQGFGDGGPGSPGGSDPGPGSDTGASSSDPGGNQADAYAPPGYGSWGEYQSDPMNSGAYSQPAPPPGINPAEWGFDPMENLTSPTSPPSSKGYGITAGVLDFITSAAIPGALMYNGLRAAADKNTIGQSIVDGLFSDMEFDTSSFPSFSFSTKTDQTNDANYDPSQEGGNDGTGGTGRIDFARLSPIEAAALIAPEVDITTSDEVQLTEPPTVDNTYGFGPGKYLYPWLVNGNTQYGSYPWKDLV